MPTVKEVLRGLYDLNEETAPRWIAEGLDSYTPEMLAEAIEEWQDPLLLARFMHLENPVIKPIVIMFVLKPYWEAIEKAQNDPEGLYCELSRDSAKKKLLDTPRGKAWLKYVSDRCYEYLRYYTWPRECPHCKSEMDRKKVQSNGSGPHDAYVCIRCKYTIDAVASAPPESLTQKPPQIPGFSH